jgi:hypothetical protein
VILPALPVPVMDAGAIFFRLIFSGCWRWMFLKRKLLLELPALEPLFFASALVPVLDQQFCNFSYWCIT